MPKVSRSTAPHQTFPGYVDAHEQEAGDWTVTIERDLTDMDYAPFFEGAPDDMCQASHVGYVLSGRFGIRRADGTEEVFEAGDAFVIEPGHTPFASAGTEYVAFTRTEEAREQMAVMMPNIVRFARERGIPLPGQMASS
ncbi:hypothetical protein [Geodermatophilus sp. SYSU D01036]